MTQSPLVPRPASTLILARDGAQGIEVFMMQRTHQAAFKPGDYVFPGGAVDPADSGLHPAACCAGLDDIGASRSLNVESGGLAYWVAAIRECFEESGLLLASDEHGELIAFHDTQVADRFSALRKKVAAGELTLADLCREHKLRIAADKLVYLSHWITPPGRPRCYDTRFFVAVAPTSQTASHDDCETIDHVWIRPADALERQRRGEWSLAFATITTLALLAGFDDTAALMDHARALTSIAPRRPRPATGRDGRRLLLQGDHAYVEVCKLDTTGAGTVSCDILPGVVTRLSDKVRRIAAPNPGFMTGPGTNTYLLGSGDEIAVIDPGPAIGEHVQTLLAQAGGRIRWIFTTHTHMDHSPAALLLKEKTGAELFGMPPPDAQRQDQSFRPDHVLAHGQRISVAGCTLRVIHTPGHASNHLCYLLEDEQMLFSGDHIMQGSTVVINPPDGDMTAYFRSLRDLQKVDIAYLAPGHGFLMDQPREAIERLLRHRLAREDKVFAALSRLGAATIEELLPIVYDDVPAGKHAVASRSLLAHLIKLKADGRATELNTQWKTSEQTAS